MTPASQNAESLKEGLVDNLALWNKVKTTDPEMSKKVKYGKREFTAIDPQWQLMQATSFGDHTEKTGGWRILILSW